MKVKLRSFIKVAFWCGLTGYGGPALVGIIKKKFVEDNKWISEKEFLEALSLSQILPGAISVTLIGNLGYKLKGLSGLILLVSFFLLPSIILIISLSWIYISFEDISFMKKIFIGLGALVVALLINATITLGKSIFGKFRINDYKGYLISIIAFCLGYFFNINIFYLILFSGLLGFLFFFFSNELEEEKPLEINGEKIIIKKPFYKNAKFYFLLFSIILLISDYLYFPLIWKIFITFFKIGAFGFGGGYTIIPLIQHQVVNELQWVTLAEFRDGIAMGQITPGPVYITTTFIGFKIAGLAGAIVATIASYTPSLIAVMVFSKVLLRIKHKKIVQSIMRGILSGFIGSLIMVVLHFGFDSLKSWQTWTIFTVSSIIIIILKKDPIWAILFTVLMTIIIL